MTDERDRWISAHWFKLLSHDKRTCILSVLEFDEPFTNFDVADAVLGGGFDKITERVLEAAQHEAYERFGK